MAGPVKLRYSHQAMVDVILQNPAIAQGELAAMFGYTQAWVSLIVNSDGFRAYLESRREELTDPVLRMELDEKFRALVDTSLKVVMEKLHKPNVTDDTALKALELGSKALGMGAKAPTTQVNNYVVALPSKAPTAAEWERQHGQIVSEQ